MISGDRSQYSFYLDTMKQFSLGLFHNYSIRLPEPSYTIAGHSTLEKNPMMRPDGFTCIFPFKSINTSLVNGIL